MSTNKRNSIINDMTRGSVFKQMVIFSIPVMFANALQLCYGLVDMLGVAMTIPAVLYYYSGSWKKRKLVA